MQIVDILTLQLAIKLATLTDSYHELLNDSKIIYGEAMREYENSLVLPRLFFPKCERGTYTTDNPNDPWWVTPGRRRQEQLPHVGEETWSTSTPLRFSSDDAGAEQMTSHSPSRRRGPGKRRQSKIPLPRPRESFAKETGQAIKMYILSEIYQWQPAVHVFIVVISIKILDQKILPGGAAFATVLCQTLFWIPASSEKHTL